MKYNIKIAGLDRWIEDIYHNAVKVTGIKENAFSYDKDYAKHIIKNWTQTDLFPKVWLMIKEQGNDKLNQLHTRAND